MSLRPRSALTLAIATATALVGTAPLPAAADDPEEPLVKRCYTEALTVEEIEAGVFSEIECFEVPADEPLALARGTVHWATIYDISNTTGDSLVLSGASCTGGGINFPSTDPWNDVISATTLVACGNAKHYTGQSFTGTNQLKTGSGYHTFTGSMNNTTSSIQYAP